MRRVLVLGALNVAVVLVSTSAASGGPPGTFSYTEDGRSAAHSNPTVEVQAGKNIVVQTFLLEPGFNGLWPTHPSDTLVLIKRGTVTMYVNCAEREVWEAGHAYYHRSGRTLVKNEAKKPAELLVIFLNVPAEHPAGVVPWDAQPPPAECAAPGTFSATEQGRAIAFSNGTVEVQAGRNIVVHSYIFEPGFNFMWHKHPGDSLFLMKRGKMTVYLSCTERELWEPGYAYLHTPGHHGYEQTTAKNEGKETVEVIGVYFNVPEWQPAPLFPREEQPPPAECPTASLL